MRKYLLLLLLTLFSFSAIHAETDWKLENGTLTISGTGDMPSYLLSVAPWYSRREEIKKVVIKDGVTNVGPAAFRKLPNIVSAIIGNSVTTIGERAFVDCSSLTSVTMSNSVTSIKSSAFGNSGLTSIVIPNSVTSIGNYAFAYCLGLTSVKMSNSVTSIGEKAFQQCERLTSIEIPNSVTSIGYCAFDGCKSLTSVKIPNSITSLGYSVFSNCSGLTSVEIPNSVTSIGTYVFSNCSGLTSIEIPNSVTSIGERAFQYCERITSIEIPNSVTSVETYAFKGCTSLTSITFKGSTPPAFGKFVFEGVNKSIPVYVPANCLEAYKKALEGFGLTNIKLPLISLNDNNAYTQDSQIDGVDVTYTRDFTHTNWQALYLPFSLSYEDWKDDFEIAYINAIHQEDNNDDGKIDKTVLEFVKMTGGSTAPNTPYLIRAKKTGEKTISVENTTVYPAEKNSIDCSTTTATFTFTGTYNDISSYLSLMMNTFYVIDGDKLSRATISKHPKAFQWYMTIKSRNDDYAEYSNPAKEITISVIDDEEATGIRQMQMTNDELPVYNSSVYDMNGRKINENSLKPGMYIKNGKKIIIK